MLNLPLTALPAPGKSVLNDFGSEKAAPSLIAIIDAAALRTALQEGHQGTQFSELHNAIEEIQQHTAAAGLLIAIGIIGAAGGIAAAVVITGGIAIVARRSLCLYYCI